MALDGLFVAMMIRHARDCSDQGALGRLITPPKFTQLLR